MSACISDFALDDVEIHASMKPEVEEHLRACPRCQERRRARSAAARYFDEVWAEPLWAHIVARRAEPRPEARQVQRRLRWLALPALAASLGAAALWMVAAPGHHLSPRYLAPKGRALVEVICRRGERTFVLAPGDEVRPGDELRFRPLPAWPAARFVQIGSVDGSGSYTPFYPADERADSVPLPGPGQALPRSIRLDGAPGPERLLVVLSAAALPAREVRAAAEAGAGRQSAVARIADAEVVSAWILLPKRIGGDARP